jgi:Flp pilus assembly protein TadG
VPALELVLLTPVVVVVLLFVVLCGRVGRAEGVVADAARAAARAGSLRADPAAARADADALTRRYLAQRAVACPAPVLDVDADVRPGGRVRVRLTCRVSLSSLTGLGLPGAVSVSADAVEVVDRYRAGQP